MIKSVKTISILGAGNVGSFLAESLYELGFVIQSIYSRNLDNAVALSERVGAMPIENLKDFDQNSDLYIIAVNDDSICKIINSLKINQGLVAHTSGTVDMKVFSRLFKRYGVLYPLQSFSKGVKTIKRNFPICIETNLANDYNSLKELSEKLVGAGNVYQIDSVQRKVLHIGAVFACNFTNYLYTVAEDLLQKNGLPFDLLKPLIMETLNKANGYSPALLQTGPAKRNDLEVMKSQLEILDSNEEYQKIYRILSDAIIQKYNK